MSLWKIFSGPSPEKLAHQAETLLKEGQWGAAKIALERALEKAETPELRARLTAEIDVSCNHLAREHLAQAATLVEGGHQADAADLFRLVMEVARDPELQEMARRDLADLERAAPAGEPDPIYYSPEPGATPSMETEAAVDEEATFWALIGTLPEDMQDAYEDYGEPFRSGYLALNRGDFELAVTLLEEAHGEHPQAGTYIPLELAAAYAHTGRAAEARELLKEFIHYHPDILPAYQLFCDLLWDAEDFDAVDDLLAGVPEDLMDTVALVLLRGENFRRAGQLDAGVAFLQQVLEDFGWNDSVAQLLAAIHTEAGNTVGARALYGEIMKHCQSCHDQVDPMVKHNYAELCFSAGQRDTPLLELYLALVQEVPAQATHYFQRVSAIYTEQGYPQEAQRFQKLAEQTQKGSSRFEIPSKS
jgi:tetratricopeptide (TPR) repeat protein